MPAVQAQLAVNSQLAFTGDELMSRVPVMGVGGQPIEWNSILDQYAQRSIPYMECDANGKFTPTDAFLNS